MECKSALISLSPYRLAELIDTLWNVNQDRKKMVETTGFEN